jgi:hypothetical protein
MQRDATGHGARCRNCLLAVEAHGRDVHAREHTDLFAFVLPALAASSGCSFINCSAHRQAEPTQQSPKQECSADRALSGTPTQAYEQSPLQTAHAARSCHRTCQRSHASSSHASSPCSDTLARPRASSATKKHAARHASAPEESDSIETLLVLGEARCRDRAFRNARGPWRLHSRARARRASVARFRRHDRRHSDTSPGCRRRRAAQRTWSARDGGFASPASSSSESSMLSHLE